MGDRNVRSNELNLKAVVRLNAFLKHACVTFCVIFLKFFSTPQPDAGCADDVSFLSHACEMVGYQHNYLLSLLEARDERS